jgi:hypothetical protein
VLGQPHRQLQGGFGGHVESGTIGDHVGSLAKVCSWSNVIFNPRAPRSSPRHAEPPGHHQHAQREKSPSTGASSNYWENLTEPTDRAGGDRLSLGARLRGTRSISRSPRMALMMPDARTGVRRGSGSSDPRRRPAPTYSKSRPRPAPAAAPSGLLGATRPRTLTRDRPGPSQVGRSTVGGTGMRDSAARGR